MQENAKAKGTNLGRIGWVSAAVAVLVGTGAAGLPGLSAAENASAETLCVLPYHGGTVCVTGLPSLGGGTTCAKIDGQPVQCAFFAPPGVYSCVPIETTNGCTGVETRP